MPSPPISPPAAKRPKLDAELPAALSSPSGPSSSRVNGHLNGAESQEPPIEDESEDEEEQPEPVKEEEDVARRDMYLDTVSTALTGVQRVSRVHPQASMDPARRQPAAARCYTPLTSQVSRSNLDFDFERLCSKSLSTINVYACLVCGKYFQGRGRGSWAYRHAVGDNHRVWLNLETEKFYVLPEGYLVSDPSLKDVLAVLNPRYDVASLAKLSDLRSPSYTLTQTPYIPGFIGMNNIKKNDYLNVIVQMLLHVPPMRDYLLNPNTPQLQEAARPTELVSRLATLCRRLWNPRLFKAQVSPHDFFQEVTKRSNGKFKTTEQGDPVEFLGWLVNTLHRDLGGSKKRNSSIIYSTFQGKVQIETQQVIIHKDYSRPVFDLSRGGLLGGVVPGANPSEIQTVSSPFLFLALDLPPTPLFQDLNEKKIIPQVALSTILAKFDGKTTQEFGPTLKRHHLSALPPYVILHIKRFTKNNFVEEKNPTIVNFPMRGVEMGPCELTQFYSSHR